MNADVLDVELYVCLTVYLTCLAAICSDEVGKSRSTHVYSETYSYISSERAGERKQGERIEKGREEERGGKKRRDEKVGECLYVHQVYMLTIINTNNEGEKKGEEKEERSVKGKKRVRKWRKVRIG